MKGIALGFAYAVIAFFVLGMLKGGWNHYFGFTDGEFGMSVLLVSGLAHALIAMILYAIPVNWLTERLRVNEIKFCGNPLYSRLACAAVISLLHAVSTFEASSRMAEFICMFVLLAPLPFFLDSEDKHIRRNWERKGDAWY